MRRFAALGCVLIAPLLSAQPGAVVAPGVVTLDSVYQMNTTFSHDGSRMYFSRCSGRGPTFDCKIYETARRGENDWVVPQVAPFSRTTSDFDPAVSPDGARMVFLSKRPRPGTSHARTDWDVWIMDRRGDGWSEPRWLGPPISSDDSEYFASLTKDGDLIFSSTRAGGAGAGDIWIARRTALGFAEPANFGREINTAQFESDPLMASDGSFLLFTSYGRSGAPGNGDIHVSHRRGNEWLRPELLDGINTPARECCAAITPDGRRLMFTREVNGFGKLFEVPLVSVGLSLSSGLPAPVDSITTAHVAGNVHVVSVWARGQAAHATLLAGPDGVLAVDIPAAAVTDTIAAIARRLSPAGIRGLASTHWHADHTGGNKRFGGLVPIVSHATVYTRRSVLQTPSWGPSGIPRLPRHALPNVLVTDSLVQTWNGERVLFMSVAPAHTDGDLVVLFEQSRVAVLGDLYFGRGRLSGSDYHSGVGYRMPEAFAEIERRLPPDTKLVTGHGGVSTMADLAEYGQRYHQTIQRLAPAIAAGQPRDTLIATLTDVWNGWGVSERDIANLLHGLRTSLAPTRAESGREVEQ